MPPANTHHNTISAAVNVLPLLWQLLTATRARGCAMACTLRRGTSHGSCPRISVTNHSGSSARRRATARASAGEMAVDDTAIATTSVLVRVLGACRHDQRGHRQPVAVAIRRRHLVHD